LNENELREAYQITLPGEGPAGIGYCEIGRKKNTSMSESGPLVRRPDEPALVLLQTYRNNPS